MNEVLTNHDIIPRMGVTFACRMTQIIKVATLSMLIVYLFLVEIVQ